MKGIGLMRFGLAACALLASLAPAMASETQDKTITKVVKLLQDMLAKSTKDGDEDKELFGKFKCYCEQSEKEKDEAIEDTSKKMSILESKIEELQGSSGQNSAKSAELKDSIAENKAARDEATSIRKKQNTAFKATEADLKQAIGQMKQAISTLGAVGADQTSSSGADNKQFMAGKKASLLSLHESMQSALTAAEAFMTDKQYHSFSSFVQAPFTGTYTSQSAEVIGIIKSMRDTFQANLETSIEDEKAQKKSYDDLMEVKNKAYKQMQSLYDEAQDILGSNDKELGSKRSQLANAKKAKEEAEEFLEKLVPMCKEKTEDYDKRKTLRANEEAAIAKAVSILNSDDAFDTFSSVSATSTGKISLLQFAATRRHLPEQREQDVRAVMQRLLRRAAAEEGRRLQGHRAPRLARVISTLQAENPFDTVLEEITKMISLIADEGKADKEKLDWCNSERKENKATLKEKTSEILKLEGEIDKLTKAIGDPVTGLKAQISQTETSLVQNTKAMTTETKDRKESNTAYQKDIKNLVTAKALLGNAIKVLKTYYDTLDKSFMQAEEDPAPPKSWKNDSYEGQSGKGGDAISMLKFILSETDKEEQEAHKDEEKAQAAYEDSMTALKKEQADKQKSLGDLQSTLADKEQELLDSKNDLKATTKDKEAVEAYLKKIKSGCDFITSNFDLREKNRATEKAALEKASSTLKGSPAYQSAVAEATVESYGKCKEPCVKDAEHVDCKACMAGTSIPGYCVGHAGTKGC